MPARPGPVLAALAAVAAAAASSGCRSDTPIVREVPIVRDVFPNPPFPEGWRVADLTFVLDASAPHVPHPRQFPFERMDLPPADSAAPRTGAFTAMEHTGTHLAAPRARHEGGPTVEAFGGTDLLLPVAVVDVPSDAASEAPVGVEAVRADERLYGTIPRGAAVFLRTRAGVRDAAHPGWAAAAVRWLEKERGARVFGTDAARVDSSAATRAPAQAAAAGAGVWCVAALRGLDVLPHRGAFVVIGALPIRDGTGSPARVVALLPPDAAPHEAPARGREEPPAPAGTPPK